MFRWIGKTVTISKVSDDVFDGKHPNGINVGYEFTGKLIALTPRLIVEDKGRGLRTSGVKMIEVNGDALAVKTVNSVYTVHEAKDKGLEKETR